jgi:hypothetical protein
MRLHVSEARKILRIVTGSRQMDGAGVKLVRVIGCSDVTELDPNMTCRGRYYSRTLAMTQRGAGNSGVHGRGWND